MQTSCSNIEHLLKETQIVRVYRRKSTKIQLPSGSLCKPRKQSTISNKIPRYGFHSTHPLKYPKYQTLKSQFCMKEQQHNNHLLTTIIQVNLR